MWSGEVPAIAARIVQALPTDAPVAVAAVAANDPASNMWIYLLGGGSAVAILKMLVDAARSALTGRWAEEKRRDASLVGQRDTAWKERDAERLGRERAERNVQTVIDYSGRLRYLCRIHGVPDEEIPPFPDLERNPDGRPAGEVP